MWLTVEVLEWNSVGALTPPIACGSSLVHTLRPWDVRERDPTPEKSGQNSYEIPYSEILAES